ncbi:hypothetical protein EV356DRAFT_457193, partial [Viridothelium virens]
MGCLAPNYDIQRFKKDLTDLSETPDQVYRDALERIKLQDERSRTLALNVLTWLAFAERALKADELAHAIAISNSIDSIRAQKASLPTSSEIPNIDTLTSSCVGLVLIDKYETVHLAHSTAEEYFRCEDSIVQHAQSILAETCLVCLNCIPLPVSNSPTLPPNEFSEYCKKYPLLNYATEQWGVHLSSVKQGHVYKLAWKFLSNERKLNKVIQFMDRLRIGHESDISGLHLAVYFGLVELVKKAMK